MLDTLPFLKHSSELELRRSKPLFCRFIKTGGCFVIIPVGTFPVVIHNPETVLGIRIAFVSSTEIPVERLFQIIFTISSEVINISKQTLGTHRTLIGCFSKPVNRFFDIFLRHLPFIIHISQNILGFCIILFRSLLTPFESFFKVLSDTFAVEIHNSQHFLSFSKTLFSSFFIQFEGLFKTFRIVVYFSQFILSFRRTEFGSFPETLHCFLRILLFFIAFTDTVQPFGSSFRISDPSYKNQENRQNGQTYIQP